MELSPIKDHVLWPGEVPKLPKESKQGKQPKQPKVTKVEPNRVGKKRRRSSDEEDEIEDDTRVYKSRGTRTRPILI